MKCESRVPAARVLTWLLAAVGVGEAYCWLENYLSVGASRFFTGGGLVSALIATLGALALCFAAGLRVAAAIRMSKAPEELRFAQARRQLSRSLLLSILGLLPFVVYAVIFVMAMMKGSYVAAWVRWIILEVAMFVLYIPVMVITRPWKIKKVSMKGTGRAAGACALAAILAVSVPIGYAAYKMVPAIIARQNITAFHTFEMEDLNGNAVTQEILTGKVTILNVWETTCAPCKQEMPALEALSEQLADTNVQIIGICFDLVPSPYVKEPHSVEEAQQILTERGVNYTNLIPSQAITAELDVLINAFPATFVLDENGNVLEFIEGSKDADGWNELAQKYLK